MAQVLYEEIITFLKETYLLNYLPLKFSDITDESLIFVYMRLLCIYDLVNKLPVSDSKLDNQFECSPSNLKHIIRCLRLLGLSYLATKQGNLLDRKKAVRIISALHDKVSAKYGKNIAQRVRLIMKKELLAKKSRSKSCAKIDADDGEGNLCLQENKILGVEMCASGQENDVPPTVPSHHCKTDIVIPIGWQIPRTPMKELSCTDATNLRNSILPPPSIPPPPAFQDTPDSKKLKREQVTNDSNLKAISNLIRTPPFEYNGHNKKVSIPEKAQNLIAQKEITRTTKNFDNLLLSAQIPTFHDSEVTTSPQKLSSSCGGAGYSFIEITKSRQTYICPKVISPQNGNEVHSKKGTFDVKDKRRTYVVPKSSLPNIKLINEPTDVQLSKGKDALYLLESSDEVQVPSLLTDLEESMEKRKPASDLEQENPLPHNWSTLDTSVRREEEGQQRLSYINAFVKLDVSSCADNKGEIPKGRDLPRTPPQISTTFDLSKHNCSEDDDRHEISSPLINKNISEGSISSEVIFSSKSGQPANVERQPTIGFEQHLNPCYRTFNISLNRKSFTVSPLSSDDSLSLFISKKKRRDNQDKEKTKKIDGLKVSEKRNEGEKKESRKVAAGRRKERKTIMKVNEEENDIAERTKNGKEATEVNAEIDNERAQYHITEEPTRDQIKSSKRNKFEKKSARGVTLPKFNEENEEPTKSTDDDVAEKRSGGPESEMKSVKSRSRKRDAKLKVTAKDTDFLEQCHDNEDATITKTEVIEMTLNQKMSEDSKTKVANKRSKIRKRSDNAGELRLKPEVRKAKTTNKQDCETEDTKDLCRTKRDEKKAKVREEKAKGSENKRVKEKKIETETKVREKKTKTDDIGNETVKGKEINVKAEDAEKEETEIKKKEKNRKAKGTEKEIETKVNEKKKSVKRRNAESIKGSKIELETKLSEKKGQLSAPRKETDILIMTESKGNSKKIGALKKRMDGNEDMNVGVKKGVAEGKKTGGRLSDRSETSRMVTEVKGIEGKGDPSEQRGETDADAKSKVKIDKQKMGKEGTKKKSKMGSHNRIEADREKKVFEAKGEFCLQGNVPDGVKVSCEVVSGTRTPLKENSLRPGRRCKTNAIDAISKMFEDTNFYF